MTPNPKIPELMSQIEALRPKDRLELLRRVLTPELELQLLVEDLSLRTEELDPEAVARDVDRAVREVRDQRRHRASA